MPERDGIHEDEEDEFLSGAKEQRPPQVFVPPNELCKKQQELRFQPFDARVGTVLRITEAAIKRVTQDGIIVDQARLEEHFYGEDGKLTDPAAFQRCPATGTTFKPPGVVCRCCHREVAPWAMKPALLDPQQEFCCGCIEKYGL